jgi:diguanylate cyclase (GGDEF)-like protein/PAS domain S-box-containing protein
MIAVALSAVVFAAAISTGSARIRADRLAPTVLFISTAFLGAYLFFAGDAAAPFSLLYLVSAGVAVWFFSGRQVLAQLGWMAATYGLAAWLDRSPTEPAWPSLSGQDLTDLVVWSGALVAVSVMIKVIRGQLADRDQRLAAIVDSSQDAIIGADRDGVITDWNHGAERLYGYNAQEAVGQPVGLLVPPTHQGEDRELLGRVLAGQRLAHYQTERVCKDGSIVRVSLSLSPIRDVAGPVIGASSIARDVTSAVRAQQAIALHAQLLDEVDAAVVLIDAAGVVRYWNHGAEELYEYGAEEASGRHLADLIMLEQSSNQLLAGSGDAQAGQLTRSEIDVHDRHGRCFPVDFRLRDVLFDGQDGPCRGAIVVSVDISERRKAQDAIGRHHERQQEIADLGRLALMGGSLQALFDYTVRMAARVLSADSVRLLERIPESSDLVVRSTVGWPDEEPGESVAREQAPAASYALTSAKPFIVQDWEQEPRGLPHSGQLRARGVRGSVAVPVSGADSLFGAIAVHFTEPGMAPPVCVPFLESVAHVLSEAIGRERAAEALRRQALHDGLTGLPNRTLFLDRVAHALARTHRRHGQLAVFFIDLDRFKLINDSLGHDAGDELLLLLANRLAGAVRKGDTIARLGGDEFAVLCDELPSEMAITRVANKLMSVLEPPVELRGEERILGASIGIAVSARESTAAELLRDAEAAMYHAKKKGNGQFELFDQDMRDRVLGRVRTESALRAALANDEEIYVHYQPLVSLQTGRVVGAEALARWRHPDWGPVSPIEFIPVAEDSGLIHELGATVIRRAARESVAWQQIPDFAGIAINVSTRQLVKPDEVSKLLSQVTIAAGIAPSFLTIEVTESLLIEQLSVAQAVLNSLRDVGVRLSLDDFGTGYSSLSYLSELPFDVVKIDRSLIRNIADTPRAINIPAAIVHMAHALELTVIAEGVETLEQATRLQRLGCDIAQGFYFAQPMAPEQLIALLHDQPHWLRSPAKQPESRHPRQLVPGC